jgi:hypothetical protein
LIGRASKIAQITAPKLIRWTIYVCTSTTVKRAPEYPDAPAQAVFANTFEGNPQLIIAGGKSPPHFDPGEYRFKIVAAGDNAPGAVCRVEIEWDGNWRHFGRAVAKLGPPFPFAVSM